MRMAELSAETEVPVATIKYYLREGLLPAGERTGPNQARYDASHVRRLRLVRAMLEIGGLSLTQVADVLAAMDAEGSGVNKIFGAAQATVTMPGLPADDDSDAARWAREQVEALIADRRWQVDAHSPAAAACARVLATMAQLGDARLVRQLDQRAEAMERVAALDLELVDAEDDIEAKVGVVVVGTVIGDALMAALRRLAQVDASARSYGEPAVSGDSGD